MLATESSTYSIVILVSESVVVFCAMMVNGMEHHHACVMPSIPPGALPR
jgi:hypothetical protein